MNNRATTPTTPTITAVLFISCCGGFLSVSVGFSGATSDFFKAGFGLCAAIAALCIGFDGWLLGGFIFDGPPSISWSAAFFCP